MEIHVSGNYTELDFPKFGASYVMIFMSYARSKK
jgi:hypothetical protein